MNFSKQRMLILDIVKKNRVHPTAEWVYNEARKELPNLGMATVYRNLRTLVQLGEIQNIVLPNYPERFDGFVEKHFHKLCTDCGKLEDLELKLDIDVYKIEEMVNNMFEHGEEDYKLNHTLLVGVCEECTHKINNMEELK